MTILNRSLLFEFAKVFLLTVAVLLLFVLLGQAIQLREMLFGLSLGLWDSIRLFVYLSPLFLVMLCPVACMMAVFLTFLRMNTDREMVALRAGGVSLYQMLPACLAFGLVCTLLTLFLAMFGQGWGMGNFREAVLDLAGNRIKVVIRPGMFNKDIPGMVLFARRVDANTGALSQVLVEDSSREDRLTILAPEGNLGTDYARGDLFFLLKNGRIYTERDESITVLGFDEYLVRMSLGTLFKGLDLGPLKPKEMAWAELMALPVERVFAENERLANKIVVERYKRLAFPLSCLILCIFAIPIAASFQGLHQQTGLIVALVFFLMYYSMLSMGISMAEGGTISAELGLWAPNLLFLILGLAGLHLASNERMPRLAYLWPWLRRKLRRSRGIGTLKPAAREQA